MGLTKNWVRNSLAFQEPYQELCREPYQEQESLSGTLLGTMLLFQEPLSGKFGNHVGNPVRHLSVENPFRFREPLLGTLLGTVLAKWNLQQKHSGQVESLRQAWFCTKWPSGNFKKTCLRKVAKRNL